MKKLILATGVIALLVAGGLVTMSLAKQDVDAKGKKALEELTDPVEMTESEYPYPLYAGQDELVGHVEVTNDGEYLYVRYVIDEEGWCLMETHLEVNADLADFPYAGKKVQNVVPGHFDYSETHECVMEYTYEIPLEWDPETSLYVGAHAVVKYTDNSCYETAVLYGIQRYDVDVYGIDVLSGESWLEFAMPTPPGANSASPNGLAYNSMNGYLYYTDYQLGTTPDTLYFWDGGSQNVAGTVTGTVANADIYEGKYYYIPTSTDDLYEVVLDGAGMISSNTKLDDIADNDHAWTFDGDIAVRDGVVYGWGKCARSGHGFEFFTYDLSSGVFSYIKPTYQQSLQLAFGSDGILYGHRSGTGGYFYEVNTTTGAVTQVTPAPDPANQYTDTASGEICVPEERTETAWGATGVGDERFTEKGNWATYFVYTVQAPEPVYVCPEITGMSENVEVLGSAPGDIRVGQLEDSLNFRVWKEYKGTLEAPLLYDLEEDQVAKTDGPNPSELSIPAGDRVCVYYVHFDQTGGTYTKAVGHLSFEQNIRGLIISGGDKGDFADKDLMFAADEQIGNGDTTYPPKSGDDRNRGFDVNWVQNEDDVYFNGNSVDFTMWVANAHDSMRVILPLVESSMGD